jgi:6-phosphogluconolactonase
VRPFDLTLLGMGEDGHFASLFPGASGTAGALQADTESLVVAIEPVAGSPRLSMTLSCLLQSRRILLLISGQRKRQVLEQAQSSMNSRQLPIAALLAIKKPDIEIIWVNT